MLEIGNRIEEKAEITKYKHQISNKFQIPISKVLGYFVVMPRDATHTKQGGAVFFYFLYSSAGILPFSLQPSAFSRLSISRAVRR